MDKLKQLINLQEKRHWLIAGGITVFTLIIISYAVFKDSSSQKMSDIQETKAVENFASGAEHGDLKTYFTNQINKKLLEQEDKVKVVEGQVESILGDKNDAIQELKQQNVILEERIKELSEKVNLAQSASNAGRQIQMPAYGGNQDFDPDILPRVNNNQNFASNQRIENLVSDEIETVTANLTNNKPLFKEVGTYLPAGTHIRGVILGGVDAHTEVYGNNQTRVVTIRFTDDGVIPNGFKGKMKDCTMLASAWGNASSERVAMRGERLTCVGATGKILETDVVATIYGSDGRQDVRGRVVYPEGKLLERAFISGSLSGIGNGVAQSFTSQSISPLGITASVPGADVFKQGAASGVGKGLDKLSDYYIKRAEQLQPIIQVGSGTLVDVVIQKGFYLDGANHSEATSDTPGSPFEQAGEMDAKKQASRTLSKVNEVME